MEPLIRPEPTEEERRAILAALAEAEPRRPALYESRWREAALDEGVAAGEIATAPASREMAIRRRRPT